MKQSNPTTEQKPSVHFTAGCLTRPTNPLIVHVIGAGGTGSRVVTELANMNNALVALGHAGFQVTLFDDDTVSKANLVRQQFTATELGMNKAVVKINTVNRGYGTNWKAVPHQFNRRNLMRLSNPAANIYISCVDTVAARFEIADIITSLSKKSKNNLNQPYYWIDFGNSKSSGQVIVSSVGEVPQPVSKKFVPVGTLPFVTDEFGEWLRKSETEDNSPSCSAAEALERQDLYINACLVPFGCDLLYKMIRHHLTTKRGYFVNLDSGQVQPLAVA